MFMAAMILSCILYGEGRDDGMNKGGSTLLLKIWEYPPARRNSMCRPAIRASHAFPNYISQSIYQSDVQFPHFERDQLNRIDDVHRYLPTFCARRPEPAPSVRFPRPVFACLGHEGTAGKDAVTVLRAGDGLCPGALTGPSGPFRRREGAIPGDALDQSQLGGLLEDGATPHNQAGGLGSGIAYSGYGDTYFAVPDRGPAGGKTSYINRLYRLDIRLTRLAENRYRVEPTLKGTQLLGTEDGHHFTGRADAFDATNSPRGLRLDPEGIRVGACGNRAYLCDEYGPHLYEIDLHSGRRLRSLPIPQKFLIDWPSAEPREERDRNLSGRQTNRGFEGVAITPDGTRLLAVVQQPLSQDGALDSDKKPLGVNCRILEIDTETGALREFVYPMDRATNGLSEILAINGHEFLVIEHDAKAEPETTFKKIFRIDLAEATDVRAIPRLPASGATVADGGENREIRPVRKTLFVDLLTAGIPNIPEKVESLAFGPDLEDGRHSLIVGVDNDFSRTLPNRLWAFAVDPADVPGFQPAPAASERACQDRKPVQTSRAGQSGTSHRHAKRDRSGGH
jgi:hypothetical protein